MTSLGGVGLGLQVPGPVPDHPQLAEVERHEDADDVELDQPGGLGVERDDQDDREASQHDDAVAVGQPIAARAQRPRHEPVAGQDRAEHREPVERGVGGQDQDDPRHRDHEVVARRKVVEDRLGQLGHHRRLVVPWRHRLAVRSAQSVDVVDVLQAHLVGQHDDAQQHRDRDRAEQQQRRGGVRALRLAEGRHAVGDRLDAGQRGATGRERARQQEDQGEPGEAAVGRVAGGRDDRVVGALDLRAGCRLRHGSRRPAPSRSRRS